MAPSRKVTKSRQERMQEEHRKYGTLKVKSVQGRKRMEEKAAKEREKVEEAPGQYEDVGFYAPQFSNNLWEVAAERRRKSKYKPRMVEGPEELYEMALEYFRWAQNNPLYEAKIFSTQKGLKKAALPKMRVFTIEGLCIFMGIARDTWDKWGKADIHPDLSGVVKEINFMIREQKFAGAAVDLLNAGLIARDLGLAEKQELSGPGGGPMEVSAKDLLAERLSRIAAATEAQDATPPKKGSKAGK